MMLKNTNGLAKLSQSIPHIRILKKSLKFKQLLNQVKEGVL